MRSSIIKTHFSMIGAMSLLTCYALINRTIIIGFNQSASLPYHGFLVIKHWPVKREQFVAFHPPPNLFYSSQNILVKPVKGVAGDRVTNIGLNYYVNGVWQGISKSHSSLGIALHPGPTGIIPPGRYYVGAKHPDSFDSRYQEIAWLNERNLIGRAFVLW